MLTGWPPFYDKNLRKMCEQILKSDLTFPASCTASPEARDLIRGLLMRDPTQRLGCRAGGVEDIKRHPFFRTIDWEKLERKELEAPFKPTVSSDTDITNFDSTFTNEPAALTPPLPSELVRARPRVMRRAAHACVRTPRTCARERAYTFGASVC
jgi:serine/threonine protein kinase